LIKEILYIIQNFLKKDDPNPLRRKKKLYH